jgi:hypothetical protein
MMGTEKVLETSVIFNQLTWLIAREDFVNFSHHESFRSYNLKEYLSLWIGHGSRISSQRLVDLLKYSHRRCMSIAMLRSNNNTCTVISSCLLSLMVVM